MKANVLALLSLVITPLQAAELEFVFTVMTTSGDYEEDIAVHSVLPFATWATGVENVPVTARPVAAQPPAPTRATSPPAKSTPNMAQRLKDLVPDFLKF